MLKFQWGGDLGHLVTLDVVGRLKSPLLRTTMKILGALGLGLGIIIIRSLVPDIFQALENTLLQFFHLASSLLDKTQVLVNAIPVSP